jgi:hypothetical protein
MRVTGVVFITASLGAVLVAQTAPASQAVAKPNAPQTQVQTGPSSLKSPFAPKVKGSAAGTSKTAQQSAVKAAANAGKQPGTSVNPHVAAKKAVPAVKASGVSPSAKQAAPKQPTAKPKTVVAHQQLKQPKKIEPAVKVKTDEAAKVTKPVEAKPKEQAPVATTSAVTEPVQRSMPNPGKRDPFVSPIAAAAMRGAASSCSSGKRCLAVDQIVLKGIVQMKEGNFALVENIARRPYVLREKDALFNGTVEKITGDSVVFHETGSDILGRATSKEVVKKVSPPAV